MKHTLIITLISAVANLQAAVAEPESKADVPEPLAEPVKCNSLVVLPNGGVLVTGGKPPKEQSYLWTPDTKKWKALEQAGMWCMGDLQVAPSNVNQLLVSGRDGFVSVDGGKTWRQAFPQYVTPEGKRVQIGTSFWSIKKPDTLLLQQMAFGKETPIFEMDVPAGKLNPWSKTPQFFSRYERVGEKHFGWMGPTDATPPICVLSDDDGKTWTPVPPEETPWSLHAIAQAQRDKLIPPSKRPVASRLAVTWAAEIGSAAFCRFECLVGEKLDPSLATLFTSSDHGKTWAAATLEKRTADVQTLFAGSPFLAKETKGRAVISPNGELKFRFDQKSQRVFAGLNGEWFVTTPTDREWHRINRLQ